MVDISTVGIVLVPKRSAFEGSRGERSEDVSFGIDILLVVEQPSLKNRPCTVIYRTVGGSVIWL